MRSMARTGKYHVFFRCDAVCSCSIFSTYEGGDDPTRDGIYPNASNEPGAYKGKDCGTVKPAYVIATSYFYQEADLTQFYMARQVWHLSADLLVFSLTL
jgi:hypothetical protein